MKRVAFHFSPKIHHAFGQLFMETISPRTYKNCPIWWQWSISYISPQKVEHKQENFLRCLIQTNLEC